MVFDSFLLKFALQCAIWITGGLLAAIVGLVLLQIYQSNMAYLDFKRKSKGLFVAKDRSIICNHTVSWGLRKNIMTDVLNYYKEHGHQTYGWLMREQFGATTLDPNLMKRVILDEPNKNTKRCKIDGPASEFMEDSIMLANGDQWRRLRRAVAPALKSSKFKAPNVIREVESSLNLLIDAIETKLAVSESQAAAASKMDDEEDGIQLKECSSTTIDSDELIHRYTLDVVFRCFYKQYDMIDFNAKECVWTELVDECLSASMDSFIIKLGLSVNMLRKPIDWLIMNFHRQGKWRIKLIDFIRAQTKLSLEARKQLEELKARGEKVNEDDFLLKDGTRFQRNLADHITDHLLDGKITQREYFNTSGFLIFAGDKTAADALVHILYRIALHSDVQEKLREAIKNDGGMESEYLDWVINESMRLMPPVPASCSRAISEELPLDNGKIIPAGTFINYPNYIIHRLKEYWGEDAEEFKPERFAKADEFHPLQFVPFGAGIRACPGREFALFVIKTFVTGLLSRYRFHCSPKEDANVFSSPFLIYLLYNSPTYIKITRL